MAIRYNDDGTIESGVTDDDVVQPFELESSNLRGLMVKMGGVVNDILGQHNYPEPVSQLLAETVTLSLLLAAMLKYDGIFTLQIKGNGAIKMLVADVTSEGEVRGYASYEEDQLKNIVSLREGGHGMVDLLGEGNIAFTVDQGSDVDRYQGMVELKGTNLVECVRHYFEQSEQIMTGVVLAAAQDGEAWRSGAILLKSSLDEGGIKRSDSEIEEDWNRANHLLETCTDAELLSTELHTADILYRLFHEEGVRIFPETPLKHACRCSRERVINVLCTLPRDEVEACKEDDGLVIITCEFCSKAYSFSDEDLKEIFDEE